MVKPGLSHAGSGVLEGCCAHASFDRGTFQETVMKSMARAILVGGIFGSIVVATQAAVGDTAALPGTAEGADQQVVGEMNSTELQPQVTELGASAGGDVSAADSSPPAETGVPAARSAPMVITVALAFPGASDDAGYRLPPKITHADLYANDRVMTAASAIPASSDDAGVHLIASRTHADMYLDRTSIAAAQPERRSADTSAD
jgi:hypothetical protein